MSTQKTVSCTSRKGEKKIQQKKGQQEFATGR